METLERPPAQELEFAVPIGPMIEETYVCAGLDYYKLTMSQMEFIKHPEAEVTFTFKNRGKQRLADYVDPANLQATFDFIRQRGWSAEEIEYFRSLRNSADEQMFGDDFLTFLVSNELPPVDVRLDETTNDIAIDTTGQWPLVTFWETVVMSEVSEQYFANYVRANGIDINDVYAEGDRRFDYKIDYLNDHLDVEVLEFSTRRRLCLRWQKHITQRLHQQAPENLLGTSNIALSLTESIKPMGTFAHEEDMVYAGIADALGKNIRAAHGEMLDDWYEVYGDDLSIALSDTFGSDFFFKDFTGERAAKWRGTRQDSGDPLAYGEKVINFYQQFGIDPMSKTTIFSDNLKLNPENNTVEPIRKQFAGRLRRPFGVGTNFGHDVGLDPLNIVMKGTHVRLPSGEEADLVKLSDDDGKHTGNIKKVRQYQEVFNGTTSA